jgi:hypothetical protein
MDLAPWIEDKITAHRVGPEQSPAALQQLVSACAALAGRGGTAFGVAPPAQGFPDGPRLCRLSCEALAEWLHSLDDAALRAQLVDVIRRNDLAVELAETVATAPRQVRLESEVLAALVERLEAAGCRILHAEDARPPARHEIDALVASVAPRTVPASLQAWIAAMPARITLAWVHESTHLSGSVRYDIATIPDLSRACAQQVDEWLHGLEHYYTVWSTAFPFLALEDGQGFIAVGEHGEVLYLDDQGNTDLNGRRLADSIDAFWRAWQGLAFLALEVDVIEKVQPGQSLGTQLGPLVAGILGAGSAAELT